MAIKTIRKDMYNDALELIGLSTDTKPTSFCVAGSTFLELDTRNAYIYDGEAWVLL